MFVKTENYERYNLSKVPGIIYLAIHSNDVFHFHIIHKQSDLPVIKLESGNIKKPSFIRNECDRILSDVDWTVKLEDMNDTHREAIKRILRNIIIDPNTMTYILRPKQKKFRMGSNQ